jgi:hypothetical protein
MNRDRYDGGGQCGKRTTKERTLNLHSMSPAWKVDERSAEQV